MTAATGAAGDTEVSMGMSEPPMTALFALSEAARPPQAPLAIAEGPCPTAWTRCGDDRSDLASRAGKHPDPRPEHGGPDEDRLAMGGKIPEHLAEGSLVRWYSAMKLLSVPMRYSTCENENRPIMQGITDTPCKRS